MTDDLEVVSKDTLNKILEMQIRIEKLEAALRLYMDMMIANNIDFPRTWEVARKALEGKDETIG